MAVAVVVTVTVIMVVVVVVRLALATIAVTVPVPVTMPVAQDGIGTPPSHCSCLLLCAAISMQLPPAPVLKHRN